jgi:hypothetical protein
MMRASAPLARALFGLSSPDEDGRTFGVHPVSGGVSYFDHGELWRNPSGRDLPSDPERIARGFLEDANRRVATDRSLGELGIRSLFAADLRVRWMGGATALSTSSPDHLLCQFECVLPVDEARVARVEGSTIDVRIGRNGRVIALRSRWRQLAGATISPQPSDPPEDPPRSSDRAFALRAPEAGAIVAPPQPAARTVIPIEPGTTVHNEARDRRPEYVYWLADEDSSQTYLAPFLLSIDGHHGGYEPVSAHSLRLDVAQKAGASGTDVAAVVSGGSGQYLYRWSYWSPIDIFASGMRSAGNAALARIPAGSWCVDLQAVDRMTGAYAHVERSTFGRASE